MPIWCPQACQFPHPIRNPDKPATYHAVGWYRKHNHGILETENNRLPARPRMRVVVRKNECLRVHWVFNRISMHYTLRLSWTSSLATLRGGPSCKALLTSYHKL